MMRENRFRKRFESDYAICIKSLLEKIIYYKKDNIYIMSYFCNAKFYSKLEKLFYLYLFSENITYLIFLRHCCFTSSPNYKEREKERNQNIAIAFSDKRHIRSFTRIPYIIYFLDVLCKTMFSFKT